MAIIDCHIIEVLVFPLILALLIATFVLLLHIIHDTGGVLAFILFVRPVALFGKLVELNVFEDEFGNNPILLSLLALFAFSLRHLVVHVFLTAFEQIEHLNNCLFTCLNFLTLIIRF